MKSMLVLALILFTGSAAVAADTCADQAAARKLAGAAKNSFITKCAKESGDRCNGMATEKNLAGAAKASFLKKCVADSAK